MDKHNILNFFKENSISEHNQAITLEYLKSIERIGRTGATLRNNEGCMRFLLANTSTDLDKLTERDRNDILDAINDWKKRTGQPASATSKRQMKILFQRFLKQYGTDTKNDKLVELSKFEYAKASSKKLKPEDVLTEEEVDLIVQNCKTLKNKALISVMFETGARVGEIQNCKLNDVKDNSYGFHILLNGKTGERQVIVYRCQQLLRQWLNDHPAREDPTAPLFPTRRRYSSNSFNVDKSKRSRAKNEVRIYEPLKEDAINTILKEAAVKAGIKKRVYCHLLRHSQATICANTMTEQQLKKQMGWTGASPMAATYVHLNNGDIDAAKLATFGVVVQKELNSNKVNKLCARCGKPVSPGIMYCECGMPLTEEAKANLEQNLIETMTEKWLESTNFFKAFTTFLERPDIQQRFGSQDKQ